MSHRTVKISRALKFNIHSDGKVYGQTSTSNGEFFVAPEVLAILTYFAGADKSDSLSVIQKIPQYLQKHFKDVLSVLPDESHCKQIVQDLIEAGFLLKETKDIQNNIGNEGFADPWIQWAMISDCMRSKSYEAAISKTVSKNSVVLDLGAGTGFLSACALKSGAKKVYAIEESNIAKTIIPTLKILNNKFFVLNKNSIIVHERNSFDVNFESDINLVVSELFGNDPFQEGIYSTLRDVAQRIQNKKNVNFIPKKMIVYGEFIDLLNHYAKDRIQQYQTVQTQNNDSFHQNFLSVIKKTLFDNSVSFPVHLTSSDFVRISASKQLGQCDLNPPPVLEKKFIGCFSGEKFINITRSLRNASVNSKQTKQQKQKLDTPVFIFWFRVYLTDEISISSHPHENDYASHWSPIAIVLNKKIDNESKLKIRYNLSPDTNLFECQIFEDDFLIGLRRCL